MGEVIKFSTRTRRRNARAALAPTASATLIPLRPSVLPEVSFAAYIGHVQRGAPDEAGTILAHLLGISLDKAIDSTEHFAVVSRKDPGLIERLQGLNELLRGKNENEILMLLYACFKIEIFDGINVIYHLRKET